MKCFKNALTYVEGKGIIRTDVLFGEKIEKIGICSFADEVVHLPENAVVLPGFIDEHIHGAGGADAMDGTQEALETIAQTVAAEGTTAFLATTMTQSPANIKAAMSAVKAYREGEHGGARLLGVAS